MDRLDDEAIERLIAHAETAPSQHSTIHIWYQGGAVGRIKTSETAFGDRSAPMLLSIEANWEDPQDDEANIAWARECVVDMRRFSDGGTYLNFAGFFEEGDQADTGRLRRELRAVGRAEERVRPDQPLSP